MKIPAVEAGLFHGDRRTDIQDRQTDRQTWW